MLNMQYSDTMLEKHIRVYKFLFDVMNEDPDEMSKLVEWGHQQLNIAWIKSSLLLNHEFQSKILKAKSRLMPVFK